MACNIGRQCRAPHGWPLHKIILIYLLFYRKACCQDVGATRNIRVSRHVVPFCAKRPDVLILALFVMEYLRNLDLEAGRSSQDLRGLHLKFWFLACKFYEGLSSALKLDWSLGWFLDLWISFDWSGVYTADDRSQRVLVFLTLNSILYRFDPSISIAKVNPTPYRLFDFWTSSSRTKCHFVHPLLCSKLESVSLLENKSQTLNTSLRAWNLSLFALL